MTPPFDRESSMLALLRALPYLRLYKGGTFVVKVGGALCGEPHALRNIVNQLGFFREVGIGVVLVHGGGPQTTELQKALGLEPRLVEGRRITDEATLAASVMTLNGTVNTALLSVCRAAGVQAVGISGLDAGLVRAVRRPVQTREVNGEKREVDFGLVGDVVSVDTAPLERLLAAGLMPVVSSLCADESGQVLNVNADTVACALACAICAQKLIFLTDTPGLLEDRNSPASLVSYIDIKGLEALRERGAIDAGMLPKVKAAREALLGGVARVHMVGYRGRANLLAEVFTNEGSGTLVVKEIAELAPAEKEPAAT